MKFTTTQVCLMYVVISVALAGVLFILVNASLRHRTVELFNANLMRMEQQRKADEMKAAEQMKQVEVVPSETTTAPTKAPAAQTKAAPKTTTGK